MVASGLVFEEDAAVVRLNGNPLLAVNSSENRKIVRINFGDVVAYEMAKRTREIISNSENTPEMLIRKSVSEKG